MHLSCNEILHSLWHREGEGSVNAAVLVRVIVPHECIHLGSQSDMAMEFSTGGVV